MLLNNKVAVIYGAGGGIGGAVARAFASEGAELFLTGRRPAPVEAVAAEVVSAGGYAEAAEVDALDEQAVDEHLQSVIDKTSRIDISFNAVGIPNARIVGVPLVELDVEQFSLPITTYATSYFLTARMAARRMVANRSGVIMTVTALHSRTGIPLVGGYGPAMAAKEALTRDLSAVGDVLEQDIREGLEPDRLCVTRGLGQLCHPLPVFRAAPARTEGIQRAVGGDPVQPGANRRPPLELLKAAPSGEQRLLEQVLGVLRRPDDPVDVELELTAIGVGQLAERVVVTGARSGEGLLGHARILARRSPRGERTGARSPATWPAAPSGSRRGNRGRRRPLR
jgi:NADP-dependent 3-hydroxy acid dehydrogenase YdfG